MANMTFKANLIPHTNAGYDLGSSSLKWNIYADDIAAAGDISTTGNLSITGNTTLSGETSAESITTGSLLVTGGATFTLIPNLPGGYLPLTGGIMTGLIKTSFKSSIAMGSYASETTTIPNLIEEVRYSSGCAGSFLLLTAYTKNSITIPTAWYNFLYIPHRSGGVNGAASDDNCSYGVLYLHNMTAPTNGDYSISWKNGSIDIVRMNALFTAAPADAKVLIADGAKGGIKSSGYTIAANVPSDAVFTDKYVKQSASTTATWHKVLLHYQEDAGATTAVTDSTNQVYATVGVSVLPSTNTLRAASFNVLGQVTLLFDSTTNALNFVFA